MTVDDDEEEENNSGGDDDPVDDGEGSIATAVEELLTIGLPLSPVLLSPPSPATPVLLLDMKDGAEEEDEEEDDDGAAMICNVFWKSFADGHSSTCTLNVLTPMLIGPLSANAPAGEE